VDGHKNLEQGLAIHRPGRGLACGENRRTDPL